MTIFSAIEYPPAIEHCQIIWPETGDFVRAIELAKRLREVGRPIGAIDTLIAGMCINRGFELMTKDADYKWVKMIEPDFKLKLRR